MKENLSISTQTKISLKAFKPEENIYDIFPTEKFNKNLSKRIFNSSELLSNISYKNQSNIKSIFNDNNKNEIFPSINFNSYSLLKKYLNKNQNIKIKNHKFFLSNLNYVYFPFNPYIQKNKTFSLEKIVNSKNLIKKIEINQELYNKLLYYDSLSKKIGKKEINLISEYLVDKINIKNCIIIPPHFIIHNKFINLIMGKIDKIIENKVKQNLSINYEYANNFVKKEIENIKHKIKIGIKKFKNKENNINENNIINNFKFTKTTYNSMNTSNNCLLHYKDDNDRIDDIKMNFLKKNNYLEYEENDSDKLSLSSIINDKNTNSHYIQSKMKNNNYNNEFSFIINYYDEEGNIIEINENNPLILYDKEGNQVRDINLENDITYYKKDGKPVFISIQNNNCNINKNNIYNSFQRKNKLIERKNNSQDLIEYNFNLKSSDNFDVLFNKNSNHNLEDINSNEGKDNDIIEEKYEKKKININKNIKDVIKKLQINKRNIFNKNYNITENKKIKSQELSYSNINNLLNNNFLKKKIINSFTSRNVINNEKTEMKEKEIKNKSENKLQKINQIKKIKITEEQKQIYEKRNKNKLDSNLKNNLRIKKLQTQTKYDSNIIKILHSKEQRENLCLTPLLVNENIKKNNNKNNEDKINREELKNNNLNLKTNLNNEEKKYDSNLKNNNLNNKINKDENKEQNSYINKTENEERNSNSFLYKNNSIIFSIIDNKKIKNKERKFYRKIYMNAPLKFKKMTKINRLKNKIENDLNDLELEFNLPVKNKKTSRSVLENKIENKSSLNQLIDKRKLHKKDSNKDVCSLIDIQFDNYDLTKNKIKRQRNYHKISSEKLFLKTSIKVKSENKNIKKDNNINNIN